MWRRGNYKGEGIAIIVIAIRPAGGDGSKAALVGGLFCFSLPQPSAVCRQPLARDEGLSYAGFLASGAWERGYAEDGESQAKYSPPGIINEP